MPGTDVAYASTAYAMPGTDLMYAGTVSAMPGTDVAYAAMPNTAYAKPVTDVAYAAMTSTDSDQYCTGVWCSSVIFLPLPYASSGTDMAYGARGGGRIDRGQLRSRSVLLSYDTTRI
eukprot:1678009-Rhodomonas_salina.1